MPMHAGHKRKIFETISYFMGMQILKMSAIQHYCGYQKEQN